MKKILIVDDDKDMLQLYELVLEGEDFTIITADNGTDGIAKTQSEHPDLVLLDLMMPGMNGIQVLEHLKADDSTKSIPVAMFTNFADDVHVKDALSKGAVKYMVKTDYEPDDLIKELRALMPS